MAPLYNKRDIMQECHARIKALSEPASVVFDAQIERVTLRLHLKNIYSMISKLAEYKQE
jgi:hypothetical protein